MELGIIIWIISIIIGVSVGSKKGEGCISFGMCVLLGPFWLPVVFLSRGNRQQCPNCKELIHKDAILCPHCRSEIRIYEVEKKKFDIKDPTTLTFIIIGILFIIMLIVVNSK